MKSSSPGFIAMTFDVFEDEDIEPIRFRRHPRREKRIRLRYSTKPCKRRTSL